MTWQQVPAVVEVVVPDDWPDDRPDDGLPPLPGLSREQRRLVARARRKRGRGGKGRR